MPPIRYPLDQPWDSEMWAQIFNHGGWGKVIDLYHALGFPGNSYQTDPTFKALHKEVNVIKDRLCKTFQSEDKCNDKAVEAGCNREYLEDDIEGLMEGFFGDEDGDL
jgi:hypothetical protein